MQNSFIITHNPKNQTVVTMDGVPAGSATYEQLTVSTSAVPLASIPNNATKALVQVDTDTIRWRDDSTDPTATTGIIGYPANFITLESRDAVEGFRAIRDTGATSDATLNILYYEKRQ